MYLKGELTIDPSQLKEVVRVKPTKGFARLAHFLTLGLSSDQEERETFCAVTILQQLYRVLRSLGIDDIVRLAKDDTVIYEDLQNRPHDLKEALDAFALKTPTMDARMFDRLELLVEYRSDEMVYLIEIWIFRRHRVGTHPIQITINGLPRELGGEHGVDERQTQLDRIFASQQSYDEFVGQSKRLFGDFLIRVRSAFEQHMRVEQVTARTEVKIVRPDRRLRDPRQLNSVTRDDHVDPVFYGDGGMSDAFFYAWLWSDMCYDHDIHCSDCIIVDSNGKDTIAVSEEGFSAREDDTLNVDIPFDEAIAADAAAQVAEASHVQPANSTLGTSDTLAEITDDSSKGFSALSTSDPDTSSGWLSGLSDFFDGGDGGGGCGSGSDCGGGGCGGGCGGGD